MILVGVLPAAFVGCGDDDDPAEDSGTPTDTGGGDSSNPMDGAGGCTDGDENTAAACMDGCDNDGDGFIDCGDPAMNIPGDNQCDRHCVEQCETMGDENNEMACTDGCDNDGNGFADCDDNACIGTMACPAENSNRACSDGIDNDNDGFVDCRDRNCFNMNDEDEQRRVCAREMTNAQCSDGDDNDGDDAVDCADEDCRGDGIVVCNGTSSVDVPEEMWPAMIEAACQNGESEHGDDGDNFVDCADFTCLFVAEYCEGASPELGNEACSDGVDNDLDGAMDCDDPSCNPDRNEAIVVCSAAGMAVTPRPTDEEITAMADALCGDGMDNDGNDFMDCGDNSCRRDSLVTACAAEESNNAACMDMSDNDEDMFTDCGDLSCTNAQVTVCSETIEVGDDQCGDGMDNDGNGFADCRDNSCNGSQNCR